MNNIDKLIQQLCPDGVEYSNLGEVAKISNGKDHKNLPDGHIPVYGSGGIMRYANEYIFDKESVLIPRKGSIGNIFYVETPFWTVDTIFYTRINCDLVSPKFLYYFLKTQHLEDLNFAGGVPSLTKTILDKVNIPIPPLPIQQEIVTILDKFTQLQAELQAELQARRAQYEYYRNELLNFEGKEVEWKTLGEVCIVSSGGTPSKAEKSYWTNGTIPWLKSEVCKEKSVFSAKDNITELGLKKSGAKLFCQSTTLMALVGATKCKTAFLEFEATTNQNIAGIKSKDENLLLDKFVFYYLMNLYKELIKNLGQYDMLNLGQIREYKIPIPPLAEQNRIVAILDKFDKLVNDISEGLPAEIQARQKQYEYYRGKLLEFEPLRND